MPIESFNGYRRNDDYLRDVARGAVPGAIGFNGYGQRTTAGAESNVLWPNGVYSVPPRTGATVSFKSDNIADTAAGTGIRTLGVVYVNTLLEEVFAVITMNGTSDSVDTLTDLVFIQCMFMVTYGSNLAAVGNISAYNGADTYSYVAAGARRCSSSMRMVPAGKRLLVLAAVAGIISGTAAAQGTVKIVTSTFQASSVAPKFDYSADSVFLPQAELGFQDASFGLPFQMPNPLSEGEIVGMAFTVDKAATITGTWFGVLENA